MAATLAWPGKDPSDVLDYSIDWAATLGADTIATSTFVAPAGITISSQSNTTTVSTAWLSGGAAGKVYEFTCTITTAGGRTLQRSIGISVHER